MRKFSPRIHGGCLALGIALSACTHTAAKEDAVKGDKDYEWLEELRSEKSLTWVTAENERSLKILESNPKYETMKKDALAIYQAQDRIPFGNIMGDHVYNFWQDAEHIKGIWRRTSWKDYSQGKPKWDVVLDLDAVAKKEGKNYVWAGAECLKPDLNLCLLRLSEAGADASFIREFDLRTKDFVPKGFELEPSKSDLTWVSRDEVLLSNAMTPDSQTDSGYPIEMRIWKRGQKWNESKLLFTGQKSDVSVRSFVLDQGGDNHVFIQRGLSFYTAEYHYVQKGQVIKLPLPEDVEISAYLKGQVILVNRKPLGKFPSGSVLAVPLAELVAGKAPYELIFSPNDKQAVNSIASDKDSVFVNLLDNVRGRIVRWTRQAPGKWKEVLVPLDSNGAASFIDFDDKSHRALISYQDFLTPQQLLTLDGKSLKVKKIMQIPERFSSKGLQIEQAFATSSDGEKIPYFMISKAKLEKNAQNPTLLYGYGGFEISMIPSYMAVPGKLWLEQGGVFVMSNIRGGGEFGPRWHQAALLENRQKAFDDFAAIAKDLIAKKVTSPQHLGIQGGSNGGLLVGASFTQHPELFQAVVCQVPLLDMLRYHKLLAGASWQAEYGNPDDPKMRDVIQKYSPFQNIDPKKNYPEVFFVTSTADDRVHPGHARKMAARMKDLGKPFLYYENIEGGHSASADLQQRARRTALEYSYLWQKLASPEKQAAALNR